MPLHEIIPVPDGLVGIWQITESCAELLPHFTPKEQKNPDFLKFSFEKRKVEWLCTRLLLKNLIGEHRISYSDHGKPILEHEFYNFISISHSRDFVAVLAHKNCEVGIDVESLSRNYSAVLIKYLSDDEIIQTGGNILLQSLYWCAKEAIFKLVPEDGVEFRKQIHILPFDPKATDQFHARFISGEKQTSCLLHFKILANNCLVWVVDETNPKEEQHGEKDHSV
jgi:phosphopantetheinyl transferase